MWHAIQNIEQNHFYKCSLEENSITYYLYNLKEIWSEKCIITEIIQRAKNLNKRICYDSETVLNTLKTGTPTTVSIEQTEDGRNVNIKYHIMGRPFNMEWNLKPLQKDEFHDIITNPMFISIHYLAEQIKELKTIIQKKDIEIKEYKAEGAVLQRKTVATEEFNEDYFNMRYPQINEMSKGFLEISKSIKEHFPLTEIQVLPENKEKSSRPSTFTSREKTKKSPNKKRKILENRRLQMLSIAKSKQNESMEYESSQSQGLSETPPQDEELAEIFQSLDELNAKRLATTPDMKKHNNSL